MIRLLFLAALCAARAGSSSKAELLLRGGKIFLSPGRYANSVAVEGGRIRALDAEAEALKGPGTRVIELGGRAVVPGFHDGHNHFAKGALFLGQVDLNGTSTEDEALARVRAYVKANPGDGWVLGRGWDQSVWKGERYPTAAELDAIEAKRPLAFKSMDGHVFWLNSEAMRRVGATRDTPDPANGRILRGAGGEPSGVFVEKAIYLVEAAIPKPSPAELEAAFERALARAASFGVTAFQGPVDVSSHSEVEAWRRLEKAGKARVRAFFWGKLEDPKGFLDLKREFSELPAERFTFLGAKGFVDGVIASHTAALLAPYSDAPKESGTPNFTQAELDARVAAARALGLQVELHAIGDRAVRMALNSCPRVSSPFPTCKIEHIEVLALEDVPRFAKQGVVASMQPSHMCYDSPEQDPTPQRLGARTRGSFVWRSLEKAGALLVFGTDWPVVPLDPREQLYAATTRRHLNGKPIEGWMPGERVSLEDAIVHYTLDPARAVGREADLGSVAVGKRADLVVFGKDLFALSGEELRTVPVDMTVFDGAVVYERKP
ncbi:MAG TPA: amidohydrolase [Elusimicrobiota bacterium]|nr:amidohydrolase [Elusimicrobiota bacterium]